MCVYGHTAAGLTFWLQTLQTTQSSAQDGPFLSLIITEKNIFCYHEVKMSPFFGITCPLSAGLTLLYWHLKKSQQPSRSSVTSPPLCLHTNYSGLISGSGETSSPSLISPNGGRKWAALRFCKQTAGVARCTNYPPGYCPLPIASNAFLKWLLW